MTTTFREKLKSEGKNVDTEELDKLKEEHSEIKSDSNSGIGETSNTNISQDSSTNSTSETPRKRGRPKGSKNASKQEQVIVPVLPPAIIKLLITAPYSMIAKKRGEHWNLSEPETESMVQVHMNLANKYLPDWLREHADLYAALSMHAMFIYIRWDIDMKMQREREEKELKEKGTQLDESSENISREKRYGKIM